MKTSALVSNASKRLQTLDAILATSLFLGLERNNHTFSLGLLIAWIGIRCGQQIWKNRHGQDWPTRILPFIIILGLTTFQARTIIRLDDNPGGSIYILLSACMLIAANYNQVQKIRLTRWINVAAFCIYTKIIALGFAEGINPFSGEWMVNINNDLLKMGFGRINSLASMLAYFAVIGFYGFRTEKNNSFMALHATSFSIGFFLCLNSTSNMAIGAPIIAISASLILFSRDYKLRPSINRYTPSIIIGSACLGLIAAWELSLKQKYIAGEHYRLNEWRCWLENSILAGNNKIIHGLGYNLEKISSICQNNNPDGGLVQLISQHGLLGLASISILLIYLFKCISYSRTIEQKKGQNTSLIKCRQSEASTGMILTVIMCNIVTPSYNGSYFNAGLIGIILSLAVFTGTSREVVR